ncbi:MAG: hypothetical protein KDD94_00400 [Calditrichaeota bacterium]|nr:hypothetical protein [Calditrichota bacterium]
MKQSININDRIETIKNTINRIDDEIVKNPTNQDLINKQTVMLKRLENLSKYSH